MAVQFFVRCQNDSMNFLPFLGGVAFIGESSLDEAIMGLVVVGFGEGEAISELNTSSKFTKMKKKIVISFVTHLGIRDSIINNNYQSIILLFLYLPAAVFWVLPFSYHHPNHFPLL